MGLLRAWVGRKTATLLTYIHKITAVLKKNLLFQARNSFILLPSFLK